jgi:hypothetical protein
MLTKTTLGFHLTPARLQTTTNIAEDAGKNEPLYTASENVH